MAPLAHKEEQDLQGHWEQWDQRVSQDFRASKDLLEQLGLRGQLDLVDQ